MRFIHTSDWHLGRRLYGKSRYDEVESFLNWLLDAIDKHNVEALLVAGDVFDSSTPSNRAQQLYYRFLAKISSTCCKHVVITSGNHDSPSFLEAPREILQHMNIQIRAMVTNDPSDEVLVLEDENHKPQMIVCAVPYLRDHDIRTVEPGEQVQDKDRKRQEGISNHYEIVCEHARKLASQLGEDIFLVAMGHLFVTGATTMDGDGVRELYVGSLSRIRAELLPVTPDYLALGHLHQPQMVGGVRQKRYSGAPFAMNFSDARIQHEVLLVDTEKPDLAIEPLAVPRFRRLETIRGDMNTIARRLTMLMNEHCNAWLEIIHDTDEVHESLGKKVRDLINGSNLEVLRIEDLRLVQRTLKKHQATETLEELEPHVVFTRCLEANHVPLAQHQDLIRCYSQILEEVMEHDSMRQ